VKIPAQTQLLYKWANLMLYVSRMGEFTMKKVFSVEGTEVFVFCGHTSATRAQTRVRSSVTLGTVPAIFRA
jgi:hypothetical protein